MPITLADLKCYAAVNHPTADLQTTGGVIQDTAHASGGYGVIFTDFSATRKARVESDGADTRTVNVTGRLASGTVVTDPIVLNGTTPVLGAQDFERILRVEVSAVSGTRTVLVRQETELTLLVTLGVNMKGSTRLFYAAASQAGAVSRYELVYFKNEHPSIPLLNAKAVLTSDSPARIKIGVAVALGDRPTIADRVQGSPPDGATFVDNGVEVGIPGGSLGAGQRIGVWVEQQLPSLDPAFKGTFTIEIRGESEL